MPVPPPPTLRLDLDADALAANWRMLDRLSGAAAAGAAVKANAYGLGAERVVEILARAGARDFFVAHWCEAPAVLAHVPGERVAVLHGPLTDADCAFARQTGVRPVLNSLEQIARWRASGGGPCDLMVDTGINRLGLPLEDLGDPLLEGLAIDTLMSHLASADEDCAQNETQLGRFRQACSTVPARRCSLANSAGIALGDRFAFDLTRPGLALYGGVPRGELAAGAIRQVAFPRAALLQVRTLGAGDAVGYNAQFVADRPMRVGVVSLGYADGFLRTRGPGEAMRFDGARLPVIGKVSMDMTVVDLGDSGAAEGDWLDVPFDLPSLAQRSGMSQYELLTTLGSRFPR